MSTTDLQPGDTIYSARDIYNDGSFPDYGEEALLVQAGSRGVVINIGHLEAAPEREVFLVRFEQPGSDALGPQIGCWPEDISELPPPPYTAHIR